MNRYSPLLFTTLEEIAIDMLDNKTLTDDPLNGDSIGNDVQETFIPINTLVFAEPLNYMNSNADENAAHSSEEIRFLDNITIQKREGKRNKYHVHIEDSHNPRCPQQTCKKSFSSVKLLRAHIRKIHCADKNRYMCEQCGRGFAEEYLLRRHSAVHRGDRIQCPVCRKLLSARTTMSTHLRSHADTRCHACVVCRRRFVRKYTLDTHMKFVHKDQRIDC